MLFNSIEFAIFLPILFMLYWYGFNKQLKTQNALLLVASYIFYGWWDWRFLTLVVFSSSLDYFIGIAMATSKTAIAKKLFLGLSIGANLGLLAFFKYFNFFIQSFSDAFLFFGQSIDVRPLNIILPVGISFYTFQTLSYSIDVYRNKLQPTRDIISFFTFVSFFPQLVAGPIERATNLLPQFYTNRSFDYNKAVDGLRQILWGLFKKVVIADNCAYYVNDIFSNYSTYNASTLALGAVLFAFQIYGDFSGYSDIAIGTARLFGFNLMQNFAFPYFSRDIAEFWRRWHISLSTWFRDYVYIPLGGSRGNMWTKIRNTFIIFIVSGLWHGANWTFVVWGGLNALYFLPLLIRAKNRLNLNPIETTRFLPAIKEVFFIVLTFCLTTIAWVFFRDKSVSVAIEYIKRMFSTSLLRVPDIMQSQLIFTMIFILLLVVVEWIQRRKEHGMQFNNKSNLRILRRTSYAAIIMLIIVYGGGQQDFIYFQF